MRVRFWALSVAVLTLAVGLVGCAAGRVPAGPANTPAPTKTLRPTFTVTVPKPTLTPSPAAGESGAQPAATTEISKPTAEPTEEPTATQAPSPTPEAAAFTVSSPAVNVRSGPGTVFPVIGRLTQGQSFPISGKSEDGDWWQFDYNGRTGWIIGTNVTARGADAVKVAQNIPQPPTAAPRPTARPAAPRPAQPAQPAQPPAQAPAAPARKYAVAGAGAQPNTNEYITVYCILYNQAGNGLLPGTMRLLREGQVVGTAEFSNLPTYYLSSGYNAGCKVETSPAINGTYTAVLVEGDQVVSDPISFTITGPENRIQFAAWKAR